MDFVRCTEESRNKKVTVTEKRKKFVILNSKKNRIRKVQVDGCLIDDDRERCDYLCEIYKPSSLVFYVELKGKGIEKAISQLGATLGYCKTVHSGMEKRCYIVSSRVPQSGPKVQVLKKRFLQTHGVQLIIKNWVIEVCV